MKSQGLPRPSCARQSSSVGNQTTPELYTLIARLNLIVVHIGMQIEPDGRIRRRVTEVIEAFDSVGDNFKKHTLFNTDPQGNLVWANEPVSDSLWQCLLARGVRLPVPVSTRPRGR